MTPSKKFECGLFIGHLVSSVLREAQSAFLLIKIMVWNSAMETSLTHFRTVSAESRFYFGSLNASVAVGLKYETNQLWRHSILHSQWKRLDEWLGSDIDMIHALSTDDETFQILSGY